MQDEIKGTGMPSREAKHLVIDNKLTQLYRSIENLENLVEKVRGEDVVEAKEPSMTKPPQICLAEFMESTPGNVEKYTARLNEILDGLEQTLF